MSISDISHLEDIALSLGISLADQLEVSLQIGDPAILADYLRWQQTRMESLGLSHSDALELLDKAGSSLAEGLPDLQSVRMRGFFREAFSRLRRTAPEIGSPAPSGLGGEAEEYTRLLLAHDRFGASELITGMVRRGVPVRDIYIHIFQYALYRVGRLWQTNQVTIAQEHFFTAATQMIMSQLYPYIFNSKRIGKRVVAAGVDTNMHDIGIRMVSDFFEMAGWDTYYLGGNTPSEVIIQALKANRAHLAAISATISQQIGVVKSAIQRVREQPDLGEIRIIVGGHPFNIAPDLWKSVGADGYAGSADEAVALAERLTAENGGTSARKANG